MVKLYSDNLAASKSYGAVARERIPTYALERPIDEAAIPLPVTVSPVDSVSIPFPPLQGLRAVEGDWNPESDKISGVKTLDTAVRILGP